MKRFMDLFLRVQEQNGGNRLSSRSLRGALLEAGFGRAEIHAAGEGFGTTERARLYAANTSAVARTKGFVDLALNQGWATPAELAALPAELLTWGERPDAFLGVLKCGALGWATGG
jgi:hypothetical protein